MGSEAEAEAREPLTIFTTTPVPQLSLFSVSPIMSIKSPSSEPSGMLTPPLQATVAAVPFRWEEEPGKPRPCTDLIISNSTALSHLELPPRLFQYQDSVKLTSPITVLEGPYNIKKRPKASSFRMARTKSHHSSPSFGSFSPSPDRSYRRSWQWQKQRRRCKEKASWLLGAWKNVGTKLELRSKRSSDHSSVCESVYRDSDDEEEEEKEEEEKWTSSSSRGATASKNRFTSITRTGSFALLSQSQTKSQFWASIYGGLKQMIPWKVKKLNKTGIAS